jgi:hypothetical protein
MPALSFRRTLSAVGVISFAALICCTGNVRGSKTVAQAHVRQHVSEQEAWKNLQYQEAVACTKCHVQPGGNDLPDPEKKKARSLDVVLLTEYAIWKTHDKHAQAFAVLKGPRGQAMADRLKQDVTKRDAGCLSCHAMDNLASRAEGGSLDRQDGVSCGGCHGPSKGKDSWYGDHSDPAWRKMSAEEKFKKGLRDLRDPAVRATLCMSCHIGNAAEGKVVTHVMFAAGHPPLPPIEIATFSRNEPQHWRDARNVPLFQNPTPETVKNYHLEDMDFQRTKFALIGGIVAMRETMYLVKGRADLKAVSPQLVWPELRIGLDEGALKDDDAWRRAAGNRWPELAMAHSDCYACHHDLQYPGYRQARGFGYQLAGRPAIRVTPGRVLVRTWPTAMLQAGISHTEKADKLAGLEANLKALAQACNLRPFGRPESVGKSADGLIGWCDDVIDDLRAVKYDSDSVLRLMHNLCELYENTENKTLTPILDYEMARQIASLLAVAHEDWRLKGGKDKGAQAVVDDLFKQFDLQPYSKRKARLGVTLGIVGKGKKLKGMPEFSQYLDNIASLEALKKLVDDRDFLPAVRGLSNDDFNKGLLEKDNVAKLQRLSDKEQEVVLDRLATYDPNRFREQLRKLAKLLPPAPQR